MNKLILGAFAATALLFAFSATGYAGTATPSKQQASQDQFTQILNSPNGYWVSASTPPPYPPPGYYAGPPPYYYGSGPYYNGPPRYYGPRYYGPPVFFGFGFHIH